MTISGYKSRNIELRSKVEPVTTNYIGEDRVGFDVNCQLGYFQASTGTVSSATVSVITVASHSAKVGDILKFTSGVLQYGFAYIQSTTSTTITISQVLVAAPSPGDTFAIFRPTIIQTDSSGNIIATISGSATATITRVAVAFSSVTLLAANAARTGLVIVNESVVRDLYIKFGSTASTSSYTYILFAGNTGNYSTLELGPGCYTGIITGITSGVGCTANITELSA